MTMSIGGAGGSDAPFPNVWQPSDSNLIGATFDPAAAGTTQILTAGTVYVMRITIRAAVTISNILFHIATVGAGASTGSFVGLYSTAGALLSGSADIGADLLTAVGRSEPLTTPQLVQPGDYYVAILVNLVTTQPTLRVGAQDSANLLNTNVTGAKLRASVPAGGTGLTALPASFTPSALTAVGAFPIFMAVA